jgi:predicted GH43/DUF377 family glycosyl hydrolase
MQNEGPTKNSRKVETLISCDHEKKGVEDPRVVKIEETYYVTYTAYDGINVMGALATSKDLIHFEKHGIITPPVNYQKVINRCNDSKLNPNTINTNLFNEIGLVG